MSICQYANLTIPQPSFDPIAIILQLVQALGLTLPQMPSSPPLPNPFCPLD